MKYVLCAVTILILIAFPISSRAQNDVDCDPNAVLDWLIRRQAWRNASGDAWNVAIAPGDVAFILHDHVQQIAALERPVCADETMLWTYYYYDAMGQFQLCLQQGQPACLERYEVQSGIYVEQVRAALVPLVELTGFDLEDYADLRPEDLTDGLMGRVSTAAAAMTLAPTPAPEVEEADLTSLESVDYAAIAANIPPAIDPARIEQVGDNGTGLPAFVSYAFEPEEIAPGVFVDLLAGWKVTETEIWPALQWEFRDEGGSTGLVDFVADIPKEFATSVDEIHFSAPPTEIIEDDPVVRWLLNVDQALQRRIEANSLALMAISEPENTLTLLEGFQVQLRAINLRRQFEACRRTTGRVLDENICALSVILQNRQYFDIGICGTFGRVVEEENAAVNVVFANACRNLLQPVDDNLHCDFDEASLRDACLALTRGVLATSCEGLTGVERDLCLYDVSAHVDDVTGCSLIEDADMANDCRAQVTGDPAYCGDISDPARREACCAIFGSDAAQYAACMGEQQAPAANEPIVEGETLTLDEVLGSAGESAGGEDSAFGPLPAAPDLDYLMNEAFYVEYICEGYDDSARYIAADGQFYFAGDDERSYPLPASIVSILAEQDHDAISTVSALTLGAPGLWMPLDGSVYSIPASTETWATDAESFDRFSALDLRPTPETLTIAGRTVNTIRYEGSYTDEVVIDRRNSTFVDGYFSSAISITHRAWYEQRTGLLVRSDFQREVLDCVREGDYADDECPTPFSMGCTLSDTSLPLGR